MSEQTKAVATVQGAEVQKTDTAGKPITMEYIHES